MDRSGRVTTLRVARRPFPIPGMPSSSSSSSSSSSDAAAAAKEERKAPSPEELPLVSEDRIELALQQQRKQQMKVLCENAPVWEYQTVRVPLEQLAKVSRQIQRQLEREVQQQLLLLQNLPKRQTKEKLDANQLASALEAILTRLQSIRSKLEDIKQVEKKLITKSIQRCKHLSIISSLALPPEGKGALEKQHKEIWNWHRTRLDRMIAEYMARKGCIKAARLIVADSNLQDLVDVDVYQTLQQISESLTKQNCQPALKWCAENRLRLKKINNNIEFNLRVQEFMELVKKQERKQAIEYAQKNLTPFVLLSSTASLAASSSSSLSSSLSLSSSMSRSLGSSVGNLAKSSSDSAGASTSLVDDPEEAKRNMKLLQRALASLSVPISLISSPQNPYRDMFGEDRWVTLKQQFEKCFFDANCFNPNPLLTSNLAFGIPALKTKKCGKEYNRNCPTCQKNFKRLGSRLPYALKASTKIVCRLSGRLMNEDNPPMVLPNGQVYSLQALQQMALENGGEIVCPITQKQFSFSQVTKAFIV